MVSDSTVVRSVVQSTHSSEATRRPTRVENEARLKQVEDELDRTHQQDQRKSEEMRQQQVFFSNLLQQQQDMIKVCYE
jgi:hypothetical protein